MIETLFKMINITFLIVVTIYLILVLSTFGALGYPQYLDVLVPEVDGRIIGGTDASIADHPHQVSIQYYHSHHCGGSLISSNWVLTAAHCVRRGTAASYTVRVGTSLATSGGTVHALTQFIVHPQYNSTIYDYDVALLQLATSQLEVRNAVSYASLASANQRISTGATATVTGWGYTVEGGTVVSQLQAVQVPMVSMASCRNSYGQTRITDRMICAGFTAGGQDACNGDSGGPLVVNSRVVGVVSWGIGCARAGYPGVYASVPNLRSWIQQNTGV